MKRRITALLLSLLFVIGTVITASPVLAAEVTDTAELSAGMSINRPSLSMGQSESYTLRVNGATAPLSWSSDSEAVAISANSDDSALITARTVGTATVTAKSRDGGYVTCKVKVSALADKLTLNKQSLLLGIGEAYDLDSYVPENTDAYYRLYRSSDPSVATVASGGGIVTAKSAGTATITCTLDNGVKAQCRVVVRPLARSLTLNYKKATMRIGDQLDLDSSAPNGTAAYYRDYTSDQPSVADVAKAGGIVTAKSAGKATIACTIRKNGVKAVCEIEVLPDPTAVPTQAPTESPTEMMTEAPTAPATQAPTQAVTEPPTESMTEAPTESGITPEDKDFALDTENLTLGLGEEYLIRTTGTADKITWASTSGAVTLTDNGDRTATAKASAVGQATVTAVTAQGSTAEMTVTVKPMAPSLKLNQTSLTLGVGEEYDLDSYAPKGTAAYFRLYSSSDPSVAAVAQGGGLVKAVAPGKAEIACVMQNGAKAVCMVEVKPLADALSLNASNLTLGIGEKVDLDSTVPKDTAAHYRLYSSSNPSVASVTESGGIVTAKVVGTAVISCNLNNGVTAKCIINVKPMSKKLYLNQTDITLAIGEEYDLDSYAAAGCAANERVYSSSKSSVATVAAAGGLVKAKSAGTATVYCTLQNGVKAKCVVTVKPMAKSLSLNDTYLRLQKGKKADLDSYVPSGYGAFYRFYSSDNPSVAKVTRADGIVTAVSPGKATVTCTLQNGVTATCEVRVMTDADARNENNGTIVNYHGHDNFCGEDVWGKGTLEASVVDWMMATWSCCSYFNGDYTWRCAEWGRYIRNTRAASMHTTDYANLTMTPGNIRSIAKGCKPGTTMSFGPKHIPSHMIVLLRVTDDRIWWADCNWNWDNCVHYREASLEEFVNFVHWLPTPNKNGYIISLTRIDRLKTFDRPKTDTARYLNRGDARIVWTAVDGAKSYEVYQVTGSGDKLVYSGNAVSYTNTKSNPGTKYTYYVKAVMKSGKKITGNTVSVYGRIHCPELEIDRDKRCIRWNAVEGASGYRVFRREGLSGSFKHITTVKGTSYKDSVMDFTAGEYDNSSYRIQAVSPKGENASSVYSDTVVVSGEYCMP
nr:Ig-like domain-containing protein [uncultured Ruminococcus sp.]